MPLLGATRRAATRALSSSVKDPNMPAVGAASTLGDEIPTLKLYRDCMKLTYHIAARSAKGDAMRAMIRASFRAQLHVTDEAEIKRLKMLAVVGLQNYVIHEQTGKAVEGRKSGPGDK